MPSSSVDAHPTLYSSLFDLVRLPWFALRDGRLVIDDSSVGPIIDMHTHVAMAFVRRNRIDLARQTDGVEHYLPAKLPIDLACYANQNIPPDQLRRVRLDLTLYGLTKSGMRKTHTLANLRREMDDLGVRYATVLPIDLPVLSNNAAELLQAVQSGFSDRFIPFGSIHPQTLMRRWRLRRQKDDGVRGIKIHPAVQAIAPDHPKTLKLCHHCANLGLPVLFHCGPVGIEPSGGRKRSQVYRYERVIAENPHLVAILGHSGALQYEQALALSRHYENVWLELSSQGLPAIRTLIAGASAERIVFGSDWPFYHQALPLAKVLIATEGDLTLRSKILYRNAARLLRIH
jgi:predicted TIM-barrel fold metal-dependent hydrolase